MFQFLIGRLKTCVVVVGVEVVIQFQFLIGRLKTSEGLKQECMFTSFNSS